MHIFEDAREYLEKMKAHEHCCGTAQVRGLLAEAERLRQALVDARNYVEHKDICEGRIDDWKLGATCTCCGDTILAEINAALSA